MAIDFNPAGKKTILSIDGGGMRGIIALGMLAHLEEQTGQPSYDLFDMIAGTSTGAIIAAGIALKMTAAEILDVYCNNLAPAFGGKRHLFFWLRYIFSRRTRYFYPLEPFIEALGPFSGDIALQDLGYAPKADHPFRKPIILMTTKDLRTGNTYYLINDGPGAAKFGHWPVKGCVAASGAAPIYFPAVLGNLVDGGVGPYGNPCLAASIEAIYYLNLAQPEDIMHVSLGTGYVPNHQADGAGTKFGIVDWVKYIIVQGIEDAALQQVQLTTATYPTMEFRRYNPSLIPEDLAKFGVTDFKGINPLKLGLDSRTPAELDLLQEIGRKFAAALDWSKPLPRPWETPGGRPQPQIKDAKWDGSIYV